MIERQMDYATAITEVSKLRKKDSPALVAIDGRCGSGKTWLAQKIKAFAPCNICCMDDFYLPLEKRQENWMEIPGGHMDLERFLEEVIKPAKAGQQVLYRPYKCRGKKMGKEVLLPESQITVVEGSYSLHPLLAAEYDLKIFLTCSKEEQKKRLQERVGRRFASFERQWIPLEEKYIQHFEIGNDCEYVIDTSDLDSIWYRPES